MMFNNLLIILPITAAHVILASNAMQPPPKDLNSDTITRTKIKTTPINQPTSNLISNNPFAPPKQSIPNQKGSVGPQAKVSNQQVLQKYLQFKSVAIINKKKYFSIFNMRTNKSFWIGENETVDNFKVINYNKISNTVTITDGINTELITIITANETPLNVVSADSQQKNKNPDVPPAPEASPTKQEKNKSKPLPRRRVVPIKR